MKVIGHRGARGLAPENTIASLQKGLEHHVDELEFDLRVTKDDVVVLNHDPVLHDPSGNALEVSTHTYDELKAHKPDLTTFEEVLDYIDAKCHLYVEVKPKVPTSPIVQIIRRNLKSGRYSASDFSLASFSQQTLRELHHELPEIQKIVIERWSGVRARLRAHEIGTKVLCMSQRWLWWGFIAGVRRSGYELYTYPLNNPHKARRWARYGLAGVVTDFPDRFEK